MADSTKSKSKTPKSKTSEKKGSLKKYVYVTLIRSKYGRPKVHRACILGLGLRRIRHRVKLEDTPSVRGMIFKVRYLLKVETADV